MNEYSKHADVFTGASGRDVRVTRKLRAWEPSPVVRGVDLKRNGLLGCADRDAEGVEYNSIVEVKLGGISLVQSVARHALSLHADDFRLGVDLMAGGEQQETAEDEGQH